MKTADGITIKQFMRVWFYTRLSGVRAAHVAVIDRRHDSVEICLGGTTRWKVAPCELFASEDATIAAYQQEGAQRR